MSKRRSLVIAAVLLIAIVGAAWFVIAYATNAGTRWEGLGAAIAFAGLTAAMLGWAFWIVPADRVVDELDVAPSDDTTRAGAVEAIEHGDAELARSKALGVLLLTTVAAIVAALLVPLRSLGPRLAGSATKWKRGSRLVREDGHPMRVSDLNVDSEVTVFPEGWIGDAMSQAALIRLPAGVGTSVQGYVAYSRVCTHAGCPVALYRAAQHQLYCPCHQSVFDAANGGHVVGGPADRALPQLPIAANADGYLVADGDFPTYVGPSSW